MDDDVTLHMTTETAVLFKRICETLISPGGAQPPPSLRDACEQVIEVIDAALGKEPSQH